MKQIIAFGASNSPTSINAAFANYAANSLQGVAVESLDLNDFSMPMYNPTEEKDNGIPQKAKDFLEKLHAADGLVISMAEYNSNWTPVFKNLFDWMSRTEGTFFRDLPVFLLATSPGGRGAISSFELALSGFPRKGAKIQAQFSLPSFNDNFSGEGITDPDLQKAFLEQQVNFQKALS